MVKYFNKANKERMMKFGVLLGVIPDMTLRLAKVSRIHKR